MSEIELIKCDICEGVIHESYKRIEVEVFSEAAEPDDTDVVSEPESQRWGISVDATATFSLPEKRLNADVCAECLPAVEDELRALIDAITEEA